jgi:sugar/nucleoside kinase (ribokinase family)
MHGPSDPYVVCVGAATLDTILAVPRHPAADDRVVASELVRAGGGPAATAAVALARLGVPVFFVGAVGDDDAGAAIRAGLEREGVDISELVVAPGARSAESAILVEAGRGSRTIAAFLGTLPALELGARARELCSGAAWTHVDHLGYGAARGTDTRLSVDAGNPIPELDLREASLYGPTEDALRAACPGLDVEAAARAALAAGAELVVVTRGADGSLAFRDDGEAVVAPALAVEPVSTLGAGDVFHGALLAQLVREVPLAAALTAANACAALACRALDGRAAIPTAQELDAVLAGSRG